MMKILSNQLDLLEAKFDTCRMVKGTPIQDNINKFNRIISDLEDIEKTLEEEDQALIIRLSLWKSYENLVQTLMLVGELLTMDETRTRTSLLVDGL